MKKDSDQQDSNTKKIVKSIATNSAVIFSLYALGFGLYPHLAFAFGAIKAIYTVLITIGVIALLIGGIALGYSNLKLKDLSEDELRNIFRDRSEEIDNINRIESSLNSPARWINLIGSFFIMIFAYKIDAHYLMTIELVSQLLLYYFVESSQVLRKHKEILMKSRPEKEAT